MKFSRIAIDTSKIAVLLIKANSMALADYDLEIKRPGASFKQEPYTFEIALGLDDVFDMVLTPAVLQLRRSGVESYVACAAQNGKLIPLEMQLTGTYAGREAIFKVKRCPYKDGRYPIDQWVMIARECKGFDFVSLFDESLALVGYRGWYSLDIAFQSFLDDVASKKLQEYQDDLLNSTGPRKTTGKMRLETYMK